MPYFAYVVDGVVQRVERIEASTMLNDEGNEVESLGQEFLASLYPETQPSDFIMTHYPVDQPDPYPRGKYASVGDLYDEEKDEFLLSEPTED